MDTTAVRISYLKKQLNAANVTQAEVANASGKTEISVSRLIRHGRDPGNILSDLEQALDKIVSRRTTEYAMLLKTEDQHTNSSGRAELFTDKIIAACKQAFTGTIVSRSEVSSQNSGE